MTELGTIRLRDLDVTGWLFVLAAGVSFFLAYLEATAAITGSGSLATTLLFGLFGLACLLFADNIARPSVDDRCNHCQTEIRVNSGTDSHDVAVKVEFAGAPDRAGVGPFSVVTARDELERTYCSAECARADLGPLHDHGTDPAEAAIIDGTDSVSVDVEEVA
jgi:hypothetical protein